MLASSLLLSVRALVVFTAVCGVIYPVVMTTLGSVIAGHKAAGSILIKDNRPVGSELIQQPWPGEAYFDGRPSSVSMATVPSGASNLGPTSIVLRKVIATLRDSIAEREGVRTGIIPAELLTTSASGVDPHISPAAAKMQIGRIVRVRGLKNNARRRLDQMIDKYTESRTLGFLGEPRVNVLKLYLALDTMKK